MHVPDRFANEQNAGRIFGANEEPCGCVAGRVAVGRPILPNRSTALPGGPLLGAPSQWPLPPRVP